MWTLLLGLTGAQAADHAWTASGAWSAAEPRLELGSFHRLDSGLQLGVLGQVGRATGVYLDGWPVSDGRTLSVLGSVTVPLVHRGVLIDLRVDAGPQWLLATETTAPVPQAFGVRAELSPMATIPLADRAALRLGWTAHVGAQVTPSVALESQAQILRGGAVIALSEAVQLGALLETGGVFGFGGDGAKYLNRGTVSLRWTPDAETSWFNL